MISLFVIIAVLASLPSLKSEDCICRDGENPIYEDDIIQKIELANVSINDIASELKMAQQNLEESEGFLKIASLDCSKQSIGSCDSAIEKSSNTGLYKIKLDNLNQKEFLVSCENQALEGGWLIVMRRQDGSIDFKKSWEEYKEGFGNLEQEFFLGLEKLHKITFNAIQQLLFIVNFESSSYGHLMYDNFVISSEEEKYRIIMLGKHSGTLKDLFTAHEGNKFSTYDADNDDSPTNCAEVNGGGWWFSSTTPCFQVFLTGKFKELSWESGMNSVEMMIRPQKL